VKKWATRPGLTNLAGETVQDLTAHALIEHVDQKVIQPVQEAPGGGALLHAKAAGGLAIAAIFYHLQDGGAQGLSPGGLALQALGPVGLGPGGLGIRQAAAVD
jgi:hypothetical protein